MRNTIIGGIILAIATFIIQKNYFTDRTEVVYSLSNEIYTSLLESEDREIIQQLTIKNIGSQVAERIVITINDHVDKYDFKKYSESDSINVIATKTKLELIYPSLPPEGQIEILIKNIKKGITKNSLVVKHNSGLGKEVFEKANSYSLLNFIPFLLWMIIIFSTGYGLYKESFQTDIKYEPIDKILKRPRPILISSFKWNEFRKEALENYFNKDRTYTKLNELICWQVLSSDKPDHLSNDEWAKVLNDAAKIFKNIFTERVVTKSYLTLSEELFFIEKPKQLQFSDWKEIVDLLNNFYIYYSFFKQRLIWTNDFAKELSNPKSKIIDIEVDKKYKAIVREMYFSKYVASILRQKRLAAFSMEYDISLLNEDQQKEIEEVTASIHDLKKTVQYGKKLDEVVSGQLKNVDNNIIEKEDWEKLVSLDKRISEILKNENQAKDDSIRFKELKERVEKQLDIIDRVIADPGYLEKIEDYNDIFSKGNFSNLLKIAAALKALNKGKKG